MDGETLELHMFHLYHKFCWEKYWEYNQLHHGNLTGKDLHFATLKDLTKEFEKTFGQYNGGYEIPLVLYNAPTECRRDFE